MDGKVENFDSVLLATNYTSNVASSLKVLFFLNSTSIKN